MHKEFKLGTLVGAGEEWPTLGKRGTWVLQKAVAAFGKSFGAMGGMGRELSGNVSASSGQAEMTMRDIGMVPAYDRVKINPITQDSKLHSYRYKTTSLPVIATI